MKIDFSTIFLVVLLVLPGLLARKSRNTIVPRSFEPQGPTAELGELVLLGLYTHLLLIAFLVGGLGLVGLLTSRSFFACFSRSAGIQLRYWTDQHQLAALSVIFCYVVSTLFVGHLSGFVYGWLDLRHPVRRALSRPRFLRGILRWLQVRSILEERPLSYEVFAALSDSGDEQIVFIELELRDGTGFLTGEVMQYAIVRDEEPHKPVILRDVWFKAQRNEEYRRVLAQKVVMDLADASFVLVEYRSTSEAASQIEQPESEVEG